MSERKLPPSFWDENHKAAAAAAAAAAATNAYADFYSSSSTSSSSDPLQSGLSGALHQLAADWHYSPSSYSRGNSSTAAAAATSYGYQPPAADYWAAASRLAQASGKAAAGAAECWSDYHTAAAAAAALQHPDYYGSAAAVQAAAAQHYSNVTSTGLHMIKDVSIASTLVSLKNYSFNRYVGKAQTILLPISLRGFFVCHSSNASPSSTSKTRPMCPARSPPPPSDETKRCETRPQCRHINDYCKLNGNEMLGRSVGEPR